MSDDFDPHSLDQTEFFEQVHSFEFWFQAVDGYLTNNPYGRSEDTVDDLDMNNHERERLITRLCNYCVGEIAALDGAGAMIDFAPNRHSKIFLATQAADEARHLEVFVHRLRDLGVEDPDAEIEKRASKDLLVFKQRLHDFVEARDWEASVFAQNVILETMESTVFRAHAATADPVTSEILLGVIKDERRHLGFGENDVGRILTADSTVRRRLTDLRTELDALVLGSFGIDDTGSAGSASRNELGREYIEAVERLGLL